MTRVRTSLEGRAASGYSADEIKGRARREAARAWKSPIPILVVALDDDRLTWPERELIRQLGERLSLPGCAAP